MWRSPAQVRGRTTPEVQQFHISQESTFSEREFASLTDDQMIQDANVQERERVTQALRDELVRLAGLRHPGGVIVKQDHCGRVGLEDDACDFARMHRGTIYGASEEHFRAD